MDAEQVVSKILSEAKGQADDIVGQAKDKCDAEQKQLDAELAEFARQTDVLAEQAAKDKTDRMLAGARMQLAKEYLAAKSVILDEVFAKAKEQIENLPDGEYVDLMNRLMAAAVETGDEKVIVGKNEKRIDMNFIKQVNRNLGPGFKGNLSLASETADISGGFVLKRGNIKTNVSVDVLVDQIRGDIEMELADEIFN